MAGFAIFAGEVLKPVLLLDRRGRLAIASGSLVRK
jgi:hypothetical protein